MKVYIKSSQGNIVHLSDLISSIDRVFIVDDARTFRRSMVCCDTDIDYMNYSDFQLMSLPTDELQDISDINVIERITKLKRLSKYATKDSYTLTKRQRDLLSNYYRQKSDVILTDNDIALVERLLADIKDYRLEVRVDHKTGTDINMDFQDKYEFNKGDYLNIIRNLSSYKPIAQKRSFNHNNLSNILLVFKPRLNLVSRGGNTITQNIKVYVKIDMTKTQSNKYHTMVYISFHESRYQ